MDTYWILGDLVAIGPQPVEVLDRISELPNVCVTRGNTDRYTTLLERPFPTQTDVRLDTDLLPVFTEIAHSFAWTLGCVAATGWFEYLADLPLEVRLELPNGTRLLGVHAAPGTDDGDGIHPESDITELRCMLADSNTDLVCIGHTHWPLDMRVENHHVVNLGSVSNHRTPDLMACYVLLETDRSGYRIVHHRVPYDRNAAISAIRAAHHPSEHYLLGFLDGRFIAHRWSEPLVRFG